MDHTPGARQFRDLGGLEDLLRRQVGPARGRARPLHGAEARAVRRATTRATAPRWWRWPGRAASSSRATTTPRAEHVREVGRRRRGDRRVPDHAEAAAASHAAGIAVLMGAPNVVRGGSHSGNVAAEALAREGVLDILSSDYVPASLLMGAFELARRIEGYGLAAALRTVTLHPARATGLDRSGPDRRRPARRPRAHPPGAGPSRRSRGVSWRPTRPLNAATARSRAIGPGTSCWSWGRAAPARTPSSRGARTAGQRSTLRVSAAHRDARGERGRGPRDRHAAAFDAARGAAPSPCIGRRTVCTTASLRRSTTPCAGEAA